MITRNFLRGPGDGVVRFEADLLLHTLNCCVFLFLHCILQFPSSTAEARTCLVMDKVNPLDLVSRDVMIEVRSVLLNLGIHS
jgi:hypothetical protein